MAENKTKSIRSIPRKPARFTVDMNTTFRVRGDADWKEGKVVNLSTGGFCLQTNAELKTGQVLEFLMDTVDRRKHKHRRLILARIVWKRLTRFGVQFVRSVSTK